MNRALALSALVGLAAAMLPGVGVAAAAPEAGAPAHRLDAMIKRPGGPWVGAEAYGKPGTQQVSGVLRTSPGRAVAVVRIVNTGSRTTALDISASSIRVAFYGGAAWPGVDRLAPGESVTFRYVGHRGSAEDGDSMPVDITVRGDGVRFLLQAK